MITCVAFVDSACLQNGIFIHPVVRNVVRRDRHERLSYTGGPPVRS